MTFWGMLTVLWLSASWAAAAVLENFQVANPPVVPRDGKQCTVQVLEHDFGFSFGEGEVVALVPPTDCGEPGTWAAVTLNLTVTSSGRQFDRLGIFTYHNVEIWRTSTPEPTADGIIWTYIKDVTPYMPLFAENGTFILQIDNLVDDTFTGIYHAIVSATYFEATDTATPAPSADLLIPLSTLSNTTGNDASVPPPFSINVTLPQNAVAVFADLIATGNAQEEFWYLNVPDQFIEDIPADIGALGRGPFREVRLLVDGQVAGAVFPYTPIYTGGIIPSIWRPIAAYGALDVPTYPLDLTPFIPLLTDGQNHTFTIDVVSAEGNHTTLDNWFVSGVLQVLVDPSSDEPTTGTILTYEADEFADTSTTGSSSGDGELDFTVTASRRIFIQSEITTGSGNTTTVVWSQDLQYSSHQTFSGNALVQVAQQSSTGNVSSTHNGSPAVLDMFSFPIDVDFRLLSAELDNWTAVIDHSYERQLLPNPLRLMTTINNHQIGAGFFQIAESGNFGNGTNNNTFSYVDSAGNTYNRRVNAALNNITLDEETGTLADLPLL